MAKTVPGPRKSHYVCAVSRWIKRGPERSKDLPTDLANDKTWTHISWFLSPMNWPWKGREQALPWTGVRLSSSATILLPYLFNLMVKKLEHGQYNLFLVLPTHWACVHRCCTVIEHPKISDPAWPCTILCRLGKGTNSLSFIKSEPWLFTSQCLCRDQVRCCESCT